MPSHILDEPIITLRPGRTIELPKGPLRDLPKPYLHWCTRCGEVFTSAEADPVKCNRCRKKYWRAPDVRRRKDGTIERTENGDSTIGI